jgi:predicted secreted acid phosphatase
MLNNPRIVYSFYFLLLLISTLFLWHKVSHAHPAQIQSEAELKIYYESGKYFKEIELKLAEVKQYLSKQSPLFRYNPRAIIFDIDETALSNYQTLKHLSFSHHPQALTSAFLQANSEAIPNVLELYQFALENKIAVFFISERPDSPEMKTATTENLHKAGFTTWQELVLKPINNENIDIKTFKSQARRKIAMQGYDILANIGDQDIDLQGGFAEVKVKLPNPFYTLS